MYFIEDKLYVLVRKINKIPYNGKVYNLDIDKQETYCVNQGLITHNCAYGTSNLMSLVRTQEAIWAIENDLILISHACAKPPLIFSCGDKEDEPWTEGQFTSFVSSTASRGPGGDIYHRGDVQSKPLPFPASSLAPLLAHLDYHVEQRMIRLGVPPDLLGISGGSNRSTAMVTMDDWINTIQLLQQQIGDCIQEQLFKPIVEKVFGEGCPIPSMAWNQIYEKDKASEIQQIMILRTSNIITTNEARAQLNDIGIKLEPVTDGDTLLPPEAFMPPEEDKVDVQEKHIIEHEGDPKKGLPSKMPPEDAVFEESVSAKAEEFSDIKINKPTVYVPKKKKPLEATQGFSEPGLPSGTGQSPGPYIQPLKKKDGKTFIEKVAAQIDKMQIRAESNRVTGQGKEDPLANQEPKDLRNVKIELLKEEDGIKCWLVSGNLVSKRYDNDWKHDGE
jgi:hypothetical protein